MLKVVAFMKQVAKGLQMEGNFGTAHVYRMGCIVADASVAKYYDGWPCAEACGYLGGRASSFQAGE